MPRELTAAEEAVFNRYQSMGTPEEIQSQISKLRKQAGKYRIRAKEAVEKLEQVTQSAEGQRVLSAEEAELFEAFKKLEIAPDELRVALEERDTLKRAVSEHQRKELLSRAAKTLGLEADDLVSFAGVDTLNIEIEMAQQTQGDQSVTVENAFVVGEDGKKVPLKEYGTTTWGRPFDILTSVRTGDEGKASKRYVVQTGKGAEGKPDPVAARIEQQKEAAAQRKLPAVITGA